MVSARCASHTIGKKGFPSSITAPLLALVIDLLPSLIEDNSFAHALQKFRTMPNVRVYVRSVCGVGAEWEVESRPYLWSTMHPKGSANERSYLANATPNLKSWNRELLWGGLDKVSFGQGFW
jgi:hypothetical protein